MLSNAKKNHSHFRDSFQKLLNLSPSLMITGIPGFAGVVETLHSATAMVETVSTLNAGLMEMEIKM